MSKRAARRARANLLARQSAHDPQLQGHHMPGSLNPHKSAGKEARKRGTGWKARQK